MKRAVYKDRTSFLLSIERNIKEEIEDIAQRENKTFSCKVNEILAEGIEQKKVIGGHDNPINISYSENKNLSWIDRIPSPNEINQLREDISSYSDAQKLQWIEAVGKTLCEVSIKKQKDIVRWY